MLLRVMSFCPGADGSGKACLYATVGMEVYQRVDGVYPVWQKVWTKPLQPNENSQSGLRGMTAYGGNYLVFAEGTDWSVLQLSPGTWSETKLYGISNLSAALGPGFGAGYAIGAYNSMAMVSVGAVWYGLIGLSINCYKYPAGTPIYWGGTAGNAPWLAQAYYLVMNGGNGQFTLKQIAAQANPTIANRFMVPDGQGNVVAGGPDFEMHTEPSDLGWIAYDTVANVVAGA